MRSITPAVAIVGAGPAGLTAAMNLARELAGDVIVLEREREPGGIPRHSFHTGYGLRDLHRSMSGPEYAKRLCEAAVHAGATIMTEATVTGVNADRTLVATTPAGRIVVQPQALILATGARERPRSARLVPGDRPGGVYTSGQLQQLVHLQHRRPGTSAVVVGAELVSWSAVLTLREAGCRTVLMTTAHRRPETYRALSMVGRGVLRVPVANRVRVVGIEGRERVHAVHIEELGTGATRRVECDTVVFTGDWIPDNELAREAGLALTAASKGVSVDTSLRSSVPGVFAIGNLVHPVDTADIAALDGRHVTAAVSDWLREGRAPIRGIRIDVQAPLRWIAPARMVPGDGPPARHRLLTWCDEFIAAPRIVVSQGGRVLSSRRSKWPAAPGRVFRIPSSALDGVDFDDGDITIALR